MLAALELWIGMQAAAVDIIVPAIATEVCRKSPLMVLLSLLCVPATHNSDSSTICGCSLQTSVANAGACLGVLADMWHDMGLCVLMHMTCVCRYIRPSLAHMMIQAVIPGHHLSVAQLYFGCGLLVASNSQCLLPQCMTIALSCPGMHPPSYHVPLPPTTFPVREPLYANAESSCWWELLLLAKHAHPSVAAFARRWGEAV